MAHHDPSVLSRNFTKLCGQAFATATSHLVHPGCFRVKTAEGFTYDSFNPRGNLAVWSILKMIESTRIFGFVGESHRWGHSFLHFRELDRTMMTASVKLTCEPELYNPSVDKQPLQVDTQLLHVGNTSLTVRSNITFPHMSKPLAVQDAGLVLVDNKTRRPSAPPGWWKETYSQHSLPNEGPVRVRPLDFSQVTGDLHEKEIVVQSADIDCYCHVNNISFVRFCYEAYIASHLRQFGYTGRGDPFRNVKALACVLRGEAGLGDLLKVAFVQDPQDGDIYHFQIHNNSKIKIFESHLQFFPQVLSKY